MTMKPLSLRTVPVASIALIVAASLLAGCANRQHITVGAVPDDYRTNHPITIAEREQTADIPVSRGDQRLSITQRSIVENAVANYQSNGSEMIYILLPSGSANQAAAYRLSTDVASVLRKGGIKPGNIATESYPVQATEASAPIRLSFYAMTAGTNPCGKWPDDVLNTPENKHYANFGCASQNNLAAQIANPADLLGPRATSPIDADRTTNVILGVPGGGGRSGGYDTTSPSKRASWGSEANY